MLRTLALVGTIALLAAASASAAGGDATATLSSSSPGARRVTLTIALREVPFRCGRMDVRSLAVVLPHTMRVPRSISAGAVRLNGVRAASVKTAGTTIDVSMPDGTSGIGCDSLFLGAAHLRISSEAALGNPARAGSYPFTVEANPRGQVWHGSLAVHG